MNESIEEVVTLAANAIREASALLICAGAGMGVDSGMPDFRGNEGFWKAYPAFKGRRFSDMSNPAWFRSDPEQAWGFFGHRYNMYASTSPHDGFEILREIGESMPLGCGVFTSNVDGHFQKAGFGDLPIVECHGSIHHQQCCDHCSGDIWEAPQNLIDVDSETIRARGDLPKCIHCDSIARPNILMFGDYGWLPTRTESQETQLAQWLRDVQAHSAPIVQTLVVIEMGAGTAIPTVRYESERHGGTLIRINPRDTDVPAGGISIPLGALDALQRIHREL